MPLIGDMNNDYSRWYLLNQTRTLDNNLIPTPTMLNHKGLSLHMEPTLAPLSFATAGYDTFTSIFNIYQKTFLLVLINIILVVVFIILKIFNFLVKSKFSWF